MFISQGTGSSGTPYSSDDLLKYSGATTTTTAETCTTTIGSIIRPPPPRAVPVTKSMIEVQHFLAQQELQRLRLHKAEIKRLIRQKESEVGRWRRLLDRQ